MMAVNYSQKRGWFTESSTSSERFTQRFLELAVPVQPSPHFAKDKNRRDLKQRWGISGLGCPEKLINRRLG